MATGNFVEQVEDLEPGAGAFTVDGGSKTRLYAITNPTVQDLQALLTTTLGGTSLAVTDGRLQRTPPLADPAFPWLYASKVGQYQGRGAFSYQNAANPLEVPTVPQWALYRDYLYTVEFTPREYPIAKDSAIANYAGSWFDFNGNLNPFTVSPEWLRYTDYQILPRTDNITCQMGQMVFQSTGAANNVPFPGMPKMYLPNQTVRMVWYQVPYRYVTSANSYFQRFLGCINQNAWWDWDEGELLYIGYNPTRYSPPVPQLVPADGGIPATPKLCNIELTFLLTHRTANDVGGLPTNQNFIAAGWNLLPWFTDRKYHFALSKPGAGLGIPSTPSWLSFPAEALFRDPDAPGGP